MLVTSFKLIGVFLGLYLSGVSAIPTAVSPNTPITPALAPREEPEDNMCNNRDLWLRRECVPEAGTTAWADVCWATVHQFEYRRGARCPTNTYCENVDDGPDETIKCVNEQPPGTSAPTKSDKDPQIGSSDNFRAPVGLTSSQFKFGVKVLNAMTASVAAFVMSEDRKFAITTINIIVGKIRGTGVTVCKGDKSSASKSKECYPTGRHPLKKGDQIDFSWGMTDQQIGSLAYTIWPS